MATAEDTRATRRPRSGRADLYPGGLIRGRGDLATPEFARGDLLHRPALSLELGPGAAMAPASLRVRGTHRLALRHGGDDRRLGVVSRCPQCRPQPGADGAPVLPGSSA